MQTTNYAQLVASAKVAARDIQRSRWTSNLLEDLRALELEGKSLDKNLESAEKALAIKKFIVAQGESLGDPRLEDYQKDLESAQKHFDLVKEDIECAKKSLQHRIDDVNKEIAAVQSGEKKVCYETMVSLARELVEKRVAQNFVNGDYDSEVEVSA